MEVKPVVQGRRGPLLENQQPLIPLYTIEETVEHPKDMGNAPLDWIAIRSC